MNEEQITRYEQLCHAHQTGVKTDIESDPTNFVGGHLDILRVWKHLRVGIDGALVEQSAVARLLMAKGIFTEAEYYSALIVAREQEVERYQRTLEERFGRKITLA